MKNFIFIGVILLLGFSCSSDKESTTNDLNNDIVVQKVSDGDGTVPRSKMIYRVYAQPENYTLEEFDKMYREDIISTAPDYDVNLKNMWYTVINERLTTEGTPALKMFYINEQTKAKQNLPNIESFYKMLASSKSFMDDDEIFSIASGFDKKNKNYIENFIQWENEKRKKQTLDNSFYEYVKFCRSMAGPR